MTPQRYRRSAVACQNCRERKVRCSVSITGVPCAGCTQDRTECVVRERLRRRRQQTGSLAARRPPQETVQVDHPRAEPNSVPLSNPSASMDRESPDLVRQAPEAVQMGISGDGGTRSISERRNEVAERTGVEISSTVLGQDKKTGQVPFYTGESPGFASILDVCAQPNQIMPRHILLSPNIPASLSIQDREFLQHKGVFTMPQENTFTELLRAYFHHIHPIMPIVDVKVFFNSSQGTQTGEWNSLLLWSMFFAAANFVGESIWSLEGYSSRKEMKYAMFSRAKCMYDNGGEMDKVVLIQSALLMGFWHSKEDGHAQPWYWVGVAISLCQILGLHRDPDSAKVNSVFPGCRRPIWRRLWWSCFFRDRWLSLTLGRPLRINLDDCDLPMPSAADLLGDVAEIPASITSAYIPSDLPQLANYWVILIKLMSASFCFLITIRFVSYGDRAALITFYRPFITRIPEHLPSAHLETWQSEVRSQLDSAALRSNSILNGLVRERLLVFASPMTPTLLVPAMHIHLLGCKSNDPLTRRVNFNKLELCMMVMEELQDTYAAAALYRGVFLVAVNKLRPHLLVDSTLRNPDVCYPSTSRVEPPEASAILPTISEDALSALLDDTSFLDIWDSFNATSDYNNIPY
ncbi:Cutinase transcription factor 1 beta [Penicillium chrysogenum]|uniref:Cutinase transcription factor 1 beta n=1 Tax=Penicillium chrysogenum TaxID=5076 RepID=A0A167T2Q6_PENCH|nr:Cutinase transcription factor 1 beta [Penicillium chrysogenum]